MHTPPNAEAPAAAQPGYTIQKQPRSRWWAVTDPTGALVCLTVYKKGATEVIRRLEHAN